jgi:hypothetical protein
LLGLEAKEVMIRAADGTDAGLIKRGERDHYLDLAKSEWGPELEELGWTVMKDADRNFTRHFTRDLRIVTDGEDSDTKAALREDIVRFPSAPIYGVNRKVDYSITFKARPNMHTMRILSRPDDARPVGRLFFFYNGLNETENLRFYYRLADWILQEDLRPRRIMEDKAHAELSGTRTACLIAPFPGHLMHAPFPGPFAQNPLSRYLSDSGELFRQFLRYMAEMRWLLGAISEDRPPEWLIGDRVPAHENLKMSIYEDWQALRDASETALKSREKDKRWTKAKKLQKLGREIDADEIGDMLDVLKSVLQLGKRGEKHRLPVHVVGYSLGGFLAQSVFFAWPNMVSSCSTICSGGAIRALSPTAFAHPEEWQAVLHTLRPELEQSLLQGRIFRKDNRIAGMSEERFSYFQRIFEQVFLQEDKASYQARLSEYASRMFFIGGGDDPIVKPKEILDASPLDGGITMLSIANLTHFLDRNPRSDREMAQRNFWLPEAARLISRAAGRAGVLRGAERAEAEAAHEEIRVWEKAVEKGERLPRVPTAKEPRERDLSSPTFEKALDWVIEGARNSGWLFVCRNILPAAFLNSEMHRAWAAGLHHHDVAVQSYALGLARHAAWLDEISPRVTMVIPDSVERNFIDVASEMIDPHSDAPGFQIPAERREAAWNAFREKWDDSVRWLDAGPIERPLLSAGSGSPYKRFADTFTKAEAGGEEVPPEYFQVAHLPDVWISFDAHPIATEKAPAEEDGAIWRFVEWVESALRNERLREEAEQNERPDGQPRAATLDNSAIGDDLREGRVRVMTVSGSELNPRYRGRFEQSPARALRALAHCAAALIRSRSEPPPE